MVPVGHVEPEQRIEVLVLGPGGIQLAQRGDIVGRGAAGVEHRESAPWGSLMASPNHWAQSRMVKSRAEDTLRGSRRAGHQIGDAVQQ